MAGCSTNWFSDPETSTSSTSVPTEDYDCADVSRPTADVPSAAGAPEPLAYPPRSAVQSTDAVEYVTEFERAYRQNEFLGRHGIQAREFELSVADSRRSSTDSDADAVVVSLVYHLQTVTAQTTHNEWNVRVTYYVDDDIALRAKYDGIATEPTFDPDPRDGGELVACLD